MFRAPHHLIAEFGNLASKRIKDQDMSSQNIKPPIAKLPEMGKSFRTRRREGKFSSFFARKGGIRIKTERFLFPFLLRKRLHNRYCFYFACCYFSLPTG